MCVITLVFVVLMLMQGVGGIDRAGAEDVRARVITAVLHMFRLLHQPALSGLWSCILQRVHTQALGPQVSLAIVVSTVTTVHCVVLY
jgi:hypothetical protein